MMGGKLGLDKLGQFKLGAAPSALGPAGLVFTRNFDPPQPQSVEFDAPKPIGEVD